MPVQEARQLPEQAVLPHGWWRPGPLLSRGPLSQWHLCHHHHDDQHHDDGSADDHLDHDEHHHQYYDHDHEHHHDGAANDHDASVQTPRAQLHMQHPTGMLQWHLPGRRRQPPQLLSAHCAW